MDLSFLDGIEKTMQGWYESVPDLPKGLREWLAKYIWIFILVGAILMTFGAISLLGAIGLFGAFSASYYGAVDYVFIAWLAFFVLVGVVILSYMAISPLKEKKRYGWQLLFLLELIYVGYGLLQWLSSPSYISNLLGTIFGAAVGFYFIFQLKEYFK